MPRKGKEKKRERDEGAESASKRRGRASEGDVAMKLGEELGEWTVVGLAGIIISKIQPQNKLKYSLICCSTRYTSALYRTFFTHT